MAAGAAWIRDYDPTRPIHYEGAQGDPTHPAYVEGKEGLNLQLNPDDPSYVDVISRMYATVDQLEAMSSALHVKRPIILCEYSHAMGNSLGNYGEYWDLIRSRPNLIGGFIWDMIDQGLLTTNERGEEYLAYGGDFGDIPNSGNFCINGVFSSDRKPNPHAWEARHVHRPVVFEGVDLQAGKIRMINRFSFTSTEDYEIHWSLCENGEVIQDGILNPVSVKPGGSDILHIPFKTEKTDPANDYHLTMSLHETKDRPWCDAGHELASDQLVLHTSDPDPEESGVPDQEVLVQDHDGKILISSTGFSLTLSREDGAIFRV